MPGHEHADRHLTRSQLVRRQATFSWRSFAWLAVLCTALAWLLQQW